jgi:N-acetylmuramoyl-L-alanine amidase
MANGENLISAVDVGKIVEPVLRPSRLKNAQKVETVVLDPGHGGTDIGAKNTWGTEKTFALDVAHIARDQLQRAGFTVEMTRSADQGLSLEERIEFANRFTNAVFVSIHFNAGHRRRRCRKLRARARRSTLNAIRRPPRVVDRCAAG